MEIHVKFEGSQILYEDNHLFIINKKPGQIVQPDKTQTPSLLEDIKDYLKIKQNKKGNVFLGAPHRLDRPTSGIVVFAKTSKALQRMTALFKERDIEKIYWAMVRNPLENTKDTLVHYLKKNPKNNKSTSFPRPTPEAKKAILHYTLLEKLDQYSLVEISLETGRHHQIRAQFSAIGNVIKGDVKYGDRRPNVDKSISLHARRISFIHPVTKEPLLIEAPIISEEGIWEKSDFIQKSAK